MNRRLLITFVVVTALALGFGIGFAAHRPAAARQPVQHSASLTVGGNAAVDYAAVVTNAGTLTFAQTVPAYRYAGPAVLVVTVRATGSEQATCRISIDGNRAAEAVAQPGTSATCVAHTL